MICEGFSRHAWELRPLREWDGELRGVVFVLRCARCGARQLWRRAGEVVVDRGRYVPKGRRVRV